MNTEIKQNYFFGLISSLVNTANLTDMDKLHNDIDLSNPTPKQASQTLTTYNQLFFLQQHKNIIHFLFKNEIIIFLDKLFIYLGNIKNELESVANGTATEDDYDELKWQASFHKNIKKLEEYAEKQLLAETHEGGWHI